MYNTKVYVQSHEKWHHVRITETSRLILYPLLSPDPNINKRTLLMDVNKVCNWCFSWSTSFHDINIYNWTLLQWFTEVQADRGGHLPACMLWPLFVLCIGGIQALALSCSAAGWPIPCMISPTPNTEARQSDCTNTATLYLTVKNSGTNAAEQKILPLTNREVLGV